MRLRQRHFKYRSIGPRAAYDARYISGLSDGAIVSSWSDLSGNGFTATQTTVGRQPTYKAAALGGSASVRFAGTTDNLTHSITPNATHTSFVAINRLSSQTGYRTIFAVGTTGAIGETLMIVRQQTVDKWGTYTSVEAIANSAVPISTPVILAMTDNGNSGGSFFYRGATDGTWTGNAIGQGLNHIGGYYTASPLLDQTVNADLGAFVMTSASLADPMRKRIEKTLAYSFKIACS